MNIFSKYLFRSMLEKKGRTILLLVSIAISAGLLVASMGSIKALVGTMTTQIKANYGDFNVVVNPDKNLGVPLFKPTNLDDKSIKNSFKGITIGGYITNSEKEFSLTGTTLKDFENFKTMKIIDKNQLEPFIGKKLIISKKTSQYLKVKIGDSINLNILGKEDEYKIAGISSNNGLFFYDKEDRFSLITPEENLFAIYGVRDKYSLVLLSIDNKSIDNWLTVYNDNNKNEKFLAAKVFDEQLVEQQLDMVRMPLYFMLVIVLLMTTFIIYSSFKLIITERLSVIGVFLSQGATKGRIIKIMLKESLVYGILGGLIGDLIGAGLTNLVAIYGNPLKDYGVKATTEYYPNYFIISFIFAVLLSLLSTIIPILSIRKLPIKDVILNTINTEYKPSMKSFVFGIVCMVVALISHLLSSKINYLSAAPCVFLGFIGVVTIIPKLVDLIFYPIVRFFRNLNGLSMLSFNNVRTSKVLINNIRLLAVSVIAIVMITSLSVSITELVKGAYDGMDFDVRIMVTSNNTKDIYDILKNYKDAKKLNETGRFATYLNGNKSRVVYVDYVDPQNYKTFEKYTSFTNKNRELDKLNTSEDGIILSKQMSVRYKIKQGDIITLATDNKKEGFKVISIFNAKTMDSGNYNLISLKAALKHFDIKYPTNYYVSSKLPQNDTKLALMKKLKGLGVNIITKEEMSKENEKSNKQFTDLLSVFAYITMVIGSFGILSNVSISFIQRKREMAVISSIGLTKSGLGYMILLESLFEALVGCIVSLIAAIGVIILFEDVFKFLIMDLSLRYPFESIGIIIIATLLLMFFTSVSTILKSKKLQIVQELKYE